MAQTQTGTVSGVAVDTTGAVIPNAKVTLQNSETGALRDTTTNAQGYFVFDRTAPGTYRISLGKADFKNTTVNNIVVRIGSTADLGQIQMQVGGASEVVEVQGNAAPLIETQSAQITGSFSAQQVQQLRQGMNGLDQLALLTPGVVPGFGNVNSNGMQVSANGQRSRSTEFTMDGLQMNDITLGGPAYFVDDFDAVSEYQVVTNQFSAELGRNLGATVNVVTKSGTNTLHGNASYLYQGSGLDAKSSLQSQNGLTKPQYVNHVWAAHLGGPIIKNKLFFYGGYLGRKQPGATTDIATSALALTPAGLQTLQTAFPNSQTLAIYKSFGVFSIPDGNPTCVGAPVTQTIAGVPGVELCQPSRNRPSNTKQYEFNGRGDWVQGRQTLSGHYTIRNVSFCCLDGGQNGGYNGFWVAQPSRSQFIGLTHTFAVTPRFTNYFRASYSKFLVSFEGSNTAPIANVRDNLTGIILPSGFASLGLANNLPQNRKLNSYQWQENMSWQKGKHLMKWGVEFDLNHTSLFFLPNINGTFQFVKSDLSDFINNTPATVQFASGDGSFAPTELDKFLYFQDDIRIRPSLTVNLGLRYEHEGQPINTAVDQVLQRESNPATAFWLQSLPLSERTLPHIPNDIYNFAPRIGFAWNPQMNNWLFGDHKTVIRGGYGLSYELAFYNLLLNITTAAPRVFAFSLTGPNAIPVPATGLGSAVATAIPVPANQFDPRSNAQTVFSPNFHNPYGQNWTLGVQRELGHSQVLEVRYVGTNGIGLFQSINANPKFTKLAADFPQFVSTGVAPCAIPGANGLGRVDCSHGPVRMRLNGGTSNYNSLQVRYDMRDFKNQFTGGLAYTWSKGIDNVSEVFSFFGGGSVAFAENPFDNSSHERGVSNQNFAQTLVVHYIWQLPWKRSQTGFLGRVLGGWNISGVSTFLSGRPFTPVQRTGNSYCGEDTGFNAAFVGFLATCRPFLANPSAPVASVGFVDNTGLVHLGSLTGAATTLDQVHFLFNNDAAMQFFTHTPFGVGRNLLRGPLTYNTDLAIEKQIRVSERVHMKYRTSMLDVFNYRNFAVPTARVDLSSFANPNKTDVGPRDTPIAGARSIRMGLWVEF